MAREHTRDLMCGICRTDLPYGFSPLRLGRVVSCNGIIVKHHWVLPAFVTLRQLDHVALAWHSTVCLAVVGRAGFLFDIRLSARLGSWKSVTRGERHGLP